MSITVQRHLLGGLSLLLLAVTLVVTAPARAEDTSPPLPFHTIEGYGGGAITPLAYLVNPTPVQGVFGAPAFAVSVVGLGKKNLDALTVSETLFGRLELSAAADRLGLGTLPTAIRTATSVDIGKSDVWLYNVNARYLLVKEGKAIPAITAGVHFKSNSDIEDIDKSLGGALTGIGLKSGSGTDLTLTATKAFPNVGGHPFIATAGLRESKAANLGFLGFGDSYKTSFEGNLIYLPTNHILLAYEIRQKSSPLGTIPGLIGKEDTWHAIDASYILNNQSTLVAGYGHFGNLANADANNAWWVQFKNEF